MFLLFDREAEEIWEKNIRGPQERQKADYQISLYPPHANRNIEGKIKKELRRSVEK